MLRVHPTIYTAHPLAWRQLLTDLGLAVSGADPAPPVAPSPEGTPTKFDAGAGRVAVHPVAAGQAEFVAFGVEVGDVAEFARRTNLWAAEAAHTPLASPPSGQGADRTCVISAGDGLSFTATTARRSADGSWTVETTADPQLGVQLLWYTPDRAAAKAALTGIGGRRRRVLLQRQKWWNLWCPVFGRGTPPRAFLHLRRRPFGAGTAARSRRAPPQHADRPEPLGGSSRLSGRLDTQRENRRRALKMSMKTGSSSPHQQLNGTATVVAAIAPRGQFWCRSEPRRVHRVRIKHERSNP